MDLRFQHPCTALVVGGTGSGKTFFMNRLIEKRDEMFNTTFEHIIFYYSEWQPLYDTLKANHRVEFREELPLLEDHPAGQGPKLIVFDKMMHEIKSHHKEILKFFIKCSHQRNLSVFFLSQCLFPDGLRQISLNAHYIVLFKTRVGTWHRLGPFVDPQHFRALIKAYKDATRAGYTYILFDFKPEQLDHLRTRTLIFPDESAVVYIPREKYKREMMTVL
ncbi:LOW QUALITY PROTEIN: Phosphatidylinositol-binding clathrin assembly protein [Frankliniella fusca]|uniref:Phosphatidylinositol-binding clathrin assembly protein n=1 Tax=Frankliniella fusca TaxID=407009 RepID=A0AAE1HK00_9NEOP|nr:LOW QUALITY PROTEIN: Phosphatidylinositol-binding clathrin assembly protein [Frankliniella fusca]